MVCTRIILLYRIDPNHNQDQERRERAMTHVELARMWKERGGRQWWIIAKSGLRLAKMALNVCETSNAG
jgi:hypothetical protein